MGPWVTEAIRAPSTAGHASTPAGRGWIGWGAGRTPGQQGRGPTRAARLRRAPPRSRCPCAGAGPSDSRRRATQSAPALAPAAQADPYATGPGPRRLGGRELPALDSDISAVDSDVSAVALRLRVRKPGPRRDFPSSAGEAPGRPGAHTARGAALAAPCTRGPRTTGARTRRVAVGNSAAAGLSAARRQPFSPHRARMAGLRAEGRRPRAAARHG